jgi:hypothetical protein
MEVKRLVIDKDLTQSDIAKMMVLLNHRFQTGFMQKDFLVLLI